MGLWISSEYKDISCIVIKVQGMDHILRLEENGFFNALELSKLLNVDHIAWKRSSKGQLAFSRAASEIGLPAEKINKLSYNVRYKGTWFHHTLLPAFISECANVAISKQIKKAYKGAKARWLKQYPVESLAAGLINDIEIKAESGNKAKTEIKTDDKVEANIEADDKAEVEVEVDDDDKAEAADEVDDKVEVGDKADDKISTPLIAKSSIASNLSTDSARLSSYESMDITKAADIMAMVAKENDAQKSLGIERKLRVTKTGEIAVVDLIATMCNCKDQKEAQLILDQIPNQVSENKPYFKSLLQHARFPGRGQYKVLVANPIQCIEIIRLCPKGREPADTFKRLCDKIAVHAIGGDRRLAQKINDVADACDAGMVPEGTLAHAFHQEVCKDQAKDPEFKSEALVKYHHENAKATIDLEFYRSDAETASKIKVAEKKLAALLDFSQLCQNKLATAPTVSHAADLQEALYQSMMDQIKCISSI